MTDKTCGTEHGVTPAICQLDPDDHGRMHQGFSHFPGQLVVWPVDTGASAPASWLDPTPEPTEPSLRSEQLELPWI